MFSNQINMKHMVHLAGSKFIADGRLLEEIILNWELDDAGEDLLRSGLS